MFLFFLLDIDFVSLYIFTYMCVKVYMWKLERNLIHNISGLIHFGFSYYVTFLFILCMCLWAWIRQAQEQRLGTICDSLPFLSTLGILRTELSHGFKCLYPLNHLNDAHFGFLLTQNPLLEYRAHQFGETSCLGISLSVLRQYKCLFESVLEIKLRSSCFLGKHLAN